MAQHVLGGVDAGDAHPALGQRQRDPSGPDRELQRRAVTGQLREQLDRRPDHGGIEHDRRVLVVRGRDALAEVLRVASHAPQFARSRAAGGATPAASQLASRICQPAGASGTVPRAVSS